MSESAHQRLQIVPGQVFRTASGTPAQLHGVGITRAGGRYYAWGEDKSAGGTFTAVACYSSVDLADWRFEGNSLTRGAGDLAAGRVIERPKVLFNALTERYVMFMHVDAADYSDARVGFAVSESPVGPYEYRGSVRPLCNASRDIGVFQEDDGTAYLLSEDRANGLQIYRLTEDYLAVESLVATTLTPDGTHGYESPAMIKHEDLYYLFGSDLTGWSTNDNKYAVARDIAGPWSDWTDFAPAGSATFNSQVSTVIPVETPHGTGFVYVGDRWLRDDLYNSPAVWLPISIGAGGARLEWKDCWTLADIEPSPENAISPSVSAR